MKKSLAPIKTKYRSRFKEAVSGLFLAALCLQPLSFSLNAQTLKKEGRKTEIVQELQPFRKEKRRSLLIWKKMLMNFCTRAKPTSAESYHQIQGKSKPFEKNGILMGDKSEPTSDAEAQEDVKFKLGTLGGKSKKTFSKMNMMSAELPLSKIRELANDENIEYISPDRPVESNWSHYYETTGAKDGNAEIPNVTVDGTGIGVAVLDSGIDTSHNLIKAGTGHPGVVFSKSFTGAVPTTDAYGHGTHVASLLAGSQAFKSNGYGGIASRRKFD